jgi:hypothetical protein
MEPEWGQVPGWGHGVGVDRPQFGKSSPVTDFFFRFGSELTVPLPIHGYADESRKLECARRSPAARSVRVPGLCLSPISGDPNAGNLRLPGRRDRHVL